MPTILNCYPLLHLMIYLDNHLRFLKKYSTVKINFLMRDRIIITMFNEEGKGFGTNVYIEDKFFVIANFNKRFNKNSKICVKIKLLKTDNL